MRNPPPRPAVGPRTIGDGVTEIHFSRTPRMIAGGGTPTVRVSYDGVAPVLMIGSMTVWLDPDQARAIAGGLAVAAGLTEQALSAWAPAALPPTTAPDGDCHLYVLPPCERDA